MTLRCPNCNQVVLATDTTCWHCHYELPQPATAPAKQAAAVTASEPFSLSAVGVYSGLTVAILIGFWLMTYILDQKPLVLLNPDTNVNAGWVPVTDQSVRYTFDIPPGWQVVEQRNLQQRQSFELLLANNSQILLAVQPYASLAEDIDLLMIITPEASETTAAVSNFVVVAHSESIGHLSLAQIITAIAQNKAVIIEEAGQFRSFVGDERATFRLHLPAAEARLTCLQHIITATETTYLVAGCAPETRYAVYQEPFTKILSSFQILR